MFGKTKMGRVAAITAIITAAALVIAAGIGFATGIGETGRAGGPGVTIDERRSVALDGADLITVSATSEDVTVVAAAGGSLEARLHGKAAAGDRERLPTLVVERSGSRAVIRVDHPAVGLMWTRLALEVSIPPSYAKGLSIGTSSGSIYVAQRVGTTLTLGATSGDLLVGTVQATDLTLKTSSGGIRVESARAATVAAGATSGDLDLGTITATDVSAHTGSGRIRAESLGANRIDLGATSGDIDVAAAGGEIHAGTSSGRIAIDFAGQPTRVDVSATSGDVSVRLPATAQFTLDARASSGDVRCAFPITISGEAAGGHHALSGTVGTPAGTLSLRTSSGSIRVEKKQ